jgi:hypothetical protein
MTKAIDDARRGQAMWSLVSVIALAAFACDETGAAGADAGGASGSAEAETPDSVVAEAEGFGDDAGDRDHYDDEGDPSAVIDALAAACAPAEPIFVGQVTNARGLGGTRLGEAAQVSCGALYRGAPLAFSGEAGCAELARIGIKTVIDLREPHERSARPAAPCVHEHARIVQAPMPIPYAVDGPAYLRDLHATEAILPAFAALGDDAAYPIYFHCTYGRDRTGVLAALVLLALGATPEEVMREYMLTAEAGLSIYPRSLTAVLDEIARLGGVDAYLAEIDVPAEQVAVLRRHGRPAPE